MLQTTYKKEVIIENELALGPINNGNIVFSTVSNFKTNSLKVYLNGVRQLEGIGNDYTISGANSFTMTIAPYYGDILLVDYRKL